MIVNSPPDPASRPGRPAQDRATAAPPRRGRGPLRQPRAPAARVVLPGDRRHADAQARGRGRPREGARVGHGEPARLALLDPGLGAATWSTAGTGCARSRTRAPSCRSRRATKRPARSPRASRRPSASSAASCAARDALAAQKSAARRPARARGPRDLARDARRAALARHARRAARADAPPARELRLGAPRHQAPARPRGCGPACARETLVERAAMVESAQERMTDRQEPLHRAQPEAGRRDREGLPQPRPLLPRPDPGGQPRPDPRGREVRPPARLQVLDLRGVVDPPGAGARDPEPLAHDPAAVARARPAAAQPARAGGAHGQARPRAHAGGARAGARHRHRLARGARPALARGDLARVARWRAPRSGSRTSSPIALALQPDGGIDDDRMRMGVGSLIGTLTDREQLILRLRYGLGGEEEHTLEQIGQSLGLSRERVRQLEARALRSCATRCRRSGSTRSSSRSPPGRSLIVAASTSRACCPEIWINVAERTGIAALRRTTRDEPDYDKLMQRRLAHPRPSTASACRDIQAVIAGMEPLAGRARVPRPAARALPGRDPVRHVLRVRGAADARSSATRRCSATRSRSTRAGRVTGYRLRHAGQKRRAVQALERPQLPRDRGRRFLQRHRHAGRGRRRHPVPAARERGREFPQFPVDAQLRRAARRVRARRGELA